MQRISLAPVLSATFSRDSCWIIRTSYSIFVGRRSAMFCEATAAQSLRLLDDLHDPPALGRRQGPGLGQPDQVALAGRVLLVVGLEPGRPPDRLPVQAVLADVLDLDHHGLVHLVGDHDPDPDLAVAPLAGRGRRALVGHRLFPLLRQLALAHDGEHPGDVLAHLAQPVRVVELAGDVLEPEVEQLLLGLGQLGGQLVRVQVGQLSCLHGHHSASTRFTNLHFIGSLWAARRMASWAVASGTPDSSNITRPGLTGATHHSGEPLPEPMRVSAGFLVTGLSGKMLVHTLPPRLIARVMAIRAASIWRAVSQPGSSAWMPYSPKASESPPLARPFVRPRWCLRWATLRGINMSVVTLSQSSPRKCGGSCASCVRRAMSSSSSSSFSSSTSASLMSGAAST